MSRTLGLMMPNTSYLPSNTYGYKKTHSVVYRHNTCRVCSEYIYHDTNKMEDRMFSRIVHISCMRKERIAKRRKERYNNTRILKETMIADKNLENGEIVLGISK